MPDYPPKKNAAFTFYLSLVSQANTKIMQANPTLAAGDVKAATDDAAPANLTTLPVVDADFTKRVKVSLSAAEMNGDNVTVIFADAAGAEWCDLTINIQTVTRQIVDLAYPTTSGRSMDIDAAGGVEVGSFQTGAVNEIVNAVFDELTAEARTAGSYGQLLKDNLNATVSSRAAAGDAMALTAAAVDAILDDGLTDSIPADGVLATVRQAIYMIQQFLLERSVAGTTVTVKKVDGATTLFTLTINDSASPTSITRAT